MRKIEEQMIRALQRGESWWSGNTRVTMDGRVYLHGNHIATWTPPNRLEYSWCGWSTNTTASRLRALCTLIDQKYRDAPKWPSRNDDPFKWYVIPEE